MALSIPQSYSHPLLTKLSPSSYEIEYRHFRPDQEPNGGVYSTNDNSRLNIHIRSAPNEVVLGSDARLCGDVRVTANFTNTNGANEVPAADIPNTVWAKVKAGGAGLPSEVGPNKPRWRWGPAMVNSSRESFDSNSLPVLENQDTTTHLVLNNLRSKFARRWVDEYDQIEDLSGAGCRDVVESGDSGYNLVYTLEGAPTNPQTLIGSSKSFSIPLGYYSDIINTDAVLNTGFFSSYAVNGFSVELQLPKLTRPTAADVDTLLTVPNNNIRGVGLVNAPEIENVPANGDGYRNVSIRVPVVKILDQAMMASQLALYEKSQMVTIGSLQFPMSLRINTLGRRLYQFPLTSGQGDYHFRLPSTERSVRGYAFQVFDRTNPNFHWTNTNLYSSAGDPVGWYYKNDGTPLEVKYSGAGNLVVSRLETRVGSRNLHCVIEDRDATTGNVKSFLSLCDRRSAHIMSPFPYWEEALKADSCQSDERYRRSWGKTTSNNYQNNYSDCYGLVSFENLDVCADCDSTEANEASGLDLTNVGGIDIDMRISTTQDNVNVFATGPLTNNYYILFAAVYDRVSEISVNGVSEISNAVI